MQKEGGRFIPFPASWLRARRWKDELANNRIGVLGRDWLGHAALSTTDRSLVTTAVALRGAARQSEASRNRASAHLSHNPADQPVPADHDPLSEVSEKSVS
jgi:hypothetical protein